MEGVKGGAGSGGARKDRRYLERTTRSACRSSCSVRSRPSSPPSLRTRRRRPPSKSWAVGSMRSEKMCALTAAAHRDTAVASVLHLTSIAVQQTPLRVTTRLLDEELNIYTDELMRHMTEHPDFTVIGVLGFQGAGKSRVLSELCGYRRQATADGRSALVGAFSEQDEAELLEGLHHTVGVEACVNVAEQLILLDVQPLLSASILVQRMRQRRDAQGVDGSRGAESYIGLDPAFTSVRHLSPPCSVFASSSDDTCAVLLCSTRISWRWRVSVSQCGCCRSATLCWWWPNKSLTSALSSCCRLRSCCSSAWTARCCCPIPRHQMRRSAIDTSRSSTSC